MVHKTLGLSQSLKNQSVVEAELDKICRSHCTECDWLIIILTSRTNLDSYHDKRNILSENFLIEKVEKFEWLFPYIYFSRSCYMCEILSYYELRDQAFIKVWRIWWSTRPQVDMQHVLFLRCIVFLLFFVTDGRTDLRTPCVKVMTTYSAEAWWANCERTNLFWNNRKMSSKEGSTLWTFKSNFKNWKLGRLYEYRPKLIYLVPNKGHWTELPHKKFLLVPFFINTLCFCTLSLKNCVWSGTFS